MLDLIKSEREKLEKHLENFTDEQLVTFNVIGEWSIKDIMAHITMDMA